jgi:iron(III) transport system substrate-binding protein
VISASVQQMTPVVDAGLVAKVDWVGLLGKELPGVNEASARMIDDYAGLGLAHWDVAFVMSYNTDQLKADEVPSRLEDLADPKWKGRLAINSAGAAPFDMMSIAWGKDKAVELMKQIVDNRPVFKNGTPGVIVAVGQGEVAVGPGQITGTHTERLKGAPIAWKPMSYVPVIPLYLYVPKNAPSPNAARLFTAWAVTEGMKIQEEMEYIGRVTDPNSFLSQEIKRMAPNAQIVEPRSLKDTALQQEATDAMVKLRGT